MKKESTDPDEPNPFIILDEIIVEASHDAWKPWKKIQYLAMRQNHLDPALNEYFTKIVSRSQRL